MKWEFLYLEDVLTNAIKIECNHEIQENYLIENAINAKLISKQHIHHKDLKRFIVKNVTLKKSINLAS